MRIAVIAAVVAVLPALATAQTSNAARYLLGEQIQRACNGPGQIAPGALIERDLTGDGRADLIIAHEGISCAGGGRSAFCGAQVCSVMLYVRQGDLLRMVEETLGGGVGVGAGAVPPITMYGHGGAPRRMTWNGSGFSG